MLEILWESLTRVSQNAVSYGVLALLLTTWLASGILFATQSETSSTKQVFKHLGLILLISAGIGLIYSLWLSGSLAALARKQLQSIDDVLNQAGSFESLLTQFYFFTFAILFALAAFLPKSWPQRAFQPSSFGIVLTPIIIIIVLVLSYFTNWRVVQADIAFKLAEPFANSGQWVVANSLYQRAKEHMPDEDYYDLFLGRGYLELAKSITNEVEKEAIFQNAETDLRKAQSTNPLNPDHTANLGRLYSWWALQTQDLAQREARGQTSDEFYSRVLVLSPNNARLWTEWGILHLDILGQPDRGLDLLNTAIDIDPKYDWPYAVIGNYYYQVARTTEDPDDKATNFQNAIHYYRLAIEQSKSMNYFYALASIYQTLNDPEGVIEVLEESLQFAKSSQDIWKIEENLAMFKFQLGRTAEALQHAQGAYNAAPDSEKERLLNLIQQIETSP